MAAHRLRADGTGGETATALAEGLRQAVARYGIGDVTIGAPEPVDVPATSRPGSTAASST